jgi:hypothetical protein
MEGQQEAIQTEEAQPLVPGTNYRTPEDVARGYSELKGVLDRQGAELGSLRAIAQEYQSMKQSQQQQAPAEPPPPDYESEVAAVYEQMDKLDPLDDNYHKAVVQLNKRAADLKAASAEQRALQKAQEMFKRELDARDQQTVYQSFHEENPDFKTPEMQMAIRERMSQDRTGMIDPLVAYREIQRDNAVAQLQDLQTRYAEAERLLNLRDGANRTGKVISGGSATKQQTNEPRLTGSALDAKLLDVFRSAG